MLVRGNRPALLMIHGWAVIHRPAPTTFFRENLTCCDLQLCSSWSL
jgi:hypothetical protein